MEHMPYLDKIWLGEYFDYNQGPDYWMTEVAGIPFGTMGEMLQDGGHLWRGMLYGMTGRYPHGEGDPRAVWKLWEEFDIFDSEMIGYWSPDCPVKTSHDQILATVYKKNDSALIALGSWAEEDAELQLGIDWDALKLNPASVTIRAPYMGDIQDEAIYKAGSPIPIKKATGALLIVK